MGDSSNISGVEVLVSSFSPRWGSDTRIRVTFSIQLLISRNGEAEFLLSFSVALIVAGVSTAEKWRGQQIPEMAPAV